MTQQTTLFDCVSSRVCFANWCTLFFPQVAEIYTITHAALKFMPWCYDTMEPIMQARGHPLSFLEEELGEGADSIDTSTPWGLGRAYADESWSYLAENDGWNADGSMGGREFNRVPFSGDFSMTDSEGNSWTPYTPRNSPYEVCMLVDRGDGDRLRY